MDIEKIIKFDYCDFEVAVPAATKKNKEDGWYKNENYDKDVFWKLACDSDGKVTRYKNYLVSNKYIIDIKKEVFVLFPYNYADLHSNRNEVSICKYNRDYLSDMEMVHGKLNRFIRFYYELGLSPDNPITRLQASFKNKLLQHGVINDELLIKAIHKVLYEKSEESSKANSATLQEVGMEVF